MVVPQPLKTTLSPPFPAHEVYIVTHFNGHTARAAGSHPARSGVTQNMVITHLNAIPGAIILVPAQPPGPTLQPATRAAHLSGERQLADLTVQYPTATGPSRTHPADFPRADSGSPRRERSASTHAAASNMDPRYVMSAGAPRLKQGAPAGGGEM